MDWLMGFPVLGELFRILRLNINIYFLQLLLVVMFAESYMFDLVIAKF